MQDDRLPRSRLKVWAALLLLPACTLTYIRWNRVWRLQATNHRRPTSPKKSADRCVCLCIRMCLYRFLYVYEHTKIYRQGDVFTLLSVSIVILPYWVIYKCMSIFQSANLYIEASRKCYIVICLTYPSFQVVDHQRKCWKVSSVLCASVNFTIHLSTNCINSWSILTLSKLRKGYRSIRIGQNFKQSIS